MGLSGLANQKIIPIWNMEMRKAQNLSKARKNSNENWMHNLLKQTKLKWRRQSIHGFRLFDFWCHDLGIVVEVDGPEHDKIRDAKHDAHAYEVSGILVLRVPNRNENIAQAALRVIAESTTWNQRRILMGLKPLTYNGIPIP